MALYSIDIQVELWWNAIQIHTLARIAGFSTPNVEDVTCTRYSTVRAQFGLNRDASRANIRIFGCQVLGIVLVTCIWGFDRLLVKRHQVARKFILYCFKYCRRRLVQQHHP